MNALLKPTTLGKLSLANHIVRSATYEGMAGPDGEITPALTDLYTNLAASQIGLIITGAAAVLPAGRGLPGMLSLHDDRLLDDYKRLADQVHQQSGKVILQLIFCGTQGFIDVPDVYSPAGIPDKLTKRAGKAMTPEDIQQLKTAFIAAAQRAITAGFDGVEIHSSAGFLLSQFLTPYYNRRTDEYGGSLENRSRLLREICAGVRQAIGAEPALLVKINCADFIDDGLCFDDSLTVCEQLAALGVDAIEITGGIAAVRDTTSVRTNIASPDQESYFAEYAGKIAAKLPIPIILNGGNRSLAVMEQWANNSKIQFFAMCRPFLAEPDLVQRWLRNDPDKARCISCNKCFSFSGTVCHVFPPKQIV